MLLSIKNENEAYIASTSLDILLFDNVQNSILKENLPFFEVKDRKGLYMFFNKLCRSEEIFRYNNDIFAEEISFQTIVNHTVPKMMGILDDEKILTIKDKEPEWDNSVLIVYNGQIYSINQNFDVSENEDYFTAGICRANLYGCLISEPEKPIRYRFAEAFKFLKSISSLDVFPLTLFNVNTSTYKECQTIEELISD